MALRIGAGTTFKANSYNGRVTFEDKLAIDRRFLFYYLPFPFMSTPVIVGIGAVAAAFAGRHLMKRGFFGAKGAADQWVKGGFRAKMDRKEALAILGLKYVCPQVENVRMPKLISEISQRWAYRPKQAQGCAPKHHACQPS